MDNRRRHHRLKHLFAAAIAVNVVLTGMLAFAEPKEASNSWLDPWRRSVGMTVGNLNPRFGTPKEEEAQAPDAATAPGTTEAGIPASLPGDTFRPGKPSPAPPGPNDPQMASLISQWLRIAEPPINATKGANLHYEEWGRVVGQAVGGIITTRGKPDGVGGRTSTEYVWSFRDKLDSVDHCTLAVYVTSRLAGQDISHCRGRYKPEPTQIASDDCSRANWHPDCDANVTGSTRRPTAEQIAQAEQAGDAMRRTTQVFTDDFTTEPGSAQPIPQVYTDDFGRSPDFSEPGDEVLDDNRRRRRRPPTFTDDIADEFSDPPDFPQSRTTSPDRDSDKPRGGDDVPAGSAPGSKPGTPAQSPGAGKPPPASKPPSAGKPPSGKVTNFDSNWHSKGTCPPADAPYCWSVALEQDGANISGKISFHKCPGGGVAYYSVSGQATENDTVQLKGEKKGGRGPLGKSSPRSQVFTVRLNTAPIPNLAKGAGCDSAPARPTPAGKPPTTTPSKPPPKPPKAAPDQKAPPATRPPAPAAPRETYGIYALFENESSIWVGAESGLQGRARGSFRYGGMCREAKECPIVYRLIKGPFSTAKQANDFFCKELEQGPWYSLGVTRVKMKWRGDSYSASSVPSCN